jgi:hypothetical protein
LLVVQPRRRVKDHVVSPTAQDGLMLPGDPKSDGCTCRSSTEGRPIFSRYALNRVLAGPRGGALRGLPTT